MRARGSETGDEVADAKARAAREHYDRWAAAYGRSRVLPSLQKKALAELAIEPSDRLLDVACGAGGLVLEIAPRIERAVGVDFSEGMLELARARQRESRAPSPNVEFLQAPSDELPFEDRSFTAIVSTTALHHFPDPRRSIEEMARVLEPTGRVVIGDFCRDSPVTKLGDPLFRRFEAGHVGLQRRRDIEAMLERAGLRVTASRHVWLHVYGLVRADRASDA